MRLWSAAIDIVYPRRCPICGEIVVPRGDKVHEKCKKLLQYVEEPRCKKCSKPLNDEESEFCFDCDKKSFHYVKGYALWIYDKSMQRSIAAYKYKGKKEYADFYLEELLKKYRDIIECLSPDALVPIPIHKDKLRQRGFNQAEKIAKGIAKDLKIPIINDLLIRVKKTQPQKSLNDRERAKNLVHAFEIAKIYQEKGPKINKVILIDDIYTTGSTIEACTKVLIEYGIKEIYFISLCIGKGC